MDPDAIKHINMPSMVMCYHHIEYDLTPEKRNIEYASSLSSIYSEDSYFAHLEEFKRELEAALKTPSPSSPSSSYNNTNSLAIHDSGNIRRCLCDRMAVSEHVEKSEENVSATVSEQGEQDSTVDVVEVPEPSQAALDSSDTSPPSSVGRGAVRAQRLPIYLAGTGSTIPPGLIYERLEVTDGQGHAGYFYYDEMTEDGIDIEHRFGYRGGGR